MAAVPLRVLVVDDEAPARDEVAYLLRRDPRVGTVQTAGNSADALKLLNDEPFDVIFCDIKMPGLDGLELARVVSRFAQRPQIVFVTAYDEHAVDAFELQATDYVMKPVRTDRLAEAVRYVEAQGDYARLHTAAGSHLVRRSLSVLEERWSAAGFVRIHRSTLVALDHVDEVRVVDGRCSVRLDGVDLPVSRRHTRELRERLARR